MARRTTRKRRAATTSSTASTSTSTSARTSSRRTRSTTRRRSSGVRRGSNIDVNKLLESIVDDAVQQLGLDILGLQREAYKEMLRPIVEGILSQYSSRPSRDTIISRMKATANNVYLFASAYLLERLEKFTPEQLEFIVSYGGPVAAKHVSKLYHEALRLDRRDLVPQIRSIWEMHGAPTPIPCPRCGFRAVTPDLYCMVCGYTLSEREAKEAIDFQERLRELVEFYGEHEVEETIEKGYVIVGETVKPPSTRLEPTDIILHLTREEREYLRKLLAERRQQHARS
ncbi:hypothetical protein [Hyperthermus butylicus]|nr:hypothetical protein [Hyperthermus butylicus]